MLIHCLSRRSLSCRQFCSQLFVGGLSFDTNESVLKDAFGQFGEIVEVKVICDRASGKSRGYGFVKYSSDVAASKASKELDGRFLDGRNIRVRNAHKGAIVKETEEICGNVEGKTQCRTQICASDMTLESRQEHIL